MSKPGINEFAGPTYRYGPKGEAQIFTDSRDVPEGWQDHPSAFAPKAGKVANTDDNALSRDELKAALTAGGIQYQQNAGTAALASLLRTKVLEVLTAKGEPF